MRYNNVNFKFVICWQMETHMLPFLPACFLPHLRLWFPCHEGKQLPTLHFELELDKQETIINMYLTRFAACKYPLFTYARRKSFVIKSFWLEKIPRKTIVVIEYEGWKNDIYLLSLVDQEVYRICYIYGRSRKFWKHLRRGFQHQTSCRKNQYRVR